MIDLQLIFVRSPPQSAWSFYQLIICPGSLCEEVLKIRHGPFFEKGLCDSGLFNRNLLKIDNAIFCQD